MRYIKEYKESPMFFSSYGSFMHKLIESYYRGFLKKEDMPTEFLVNFSSKVAGSRPKEKVVKNYIESGLEYLKSFTPFPYKTLDVEKRVDFKIEGFSFVGYIDYLGEENGELVIVDNKSRDMRPRSFRKTPTRKDEELDEMLKQLYIYSLAVYQEFGKFPKYLCFNCFRTKTFIKEPFKEDECLKTKDWALQSIKDISETEGFSPHIDYFSCNYICGFGNYCEYKSLGDDKN